MKTVEPEPEPEQVILCTMTFDDEIRYCSGDMWVGVKLLPKAPVYRDFRVAPMVTMVTD